MTKPKKSSERVVAINTETIELAQFLKFAGAKESGGQAKQAIVDGEVSVNGAVETRKGRKLVGGDKVEIAGETLLVEIAE